MLVLTRKIEEKIIIELKGEKIEIILFRADRGYAKMGFKAGRDAIIYREELIT